MLLAVTVSLWAAHVDRVKRDEKLRDSITRLHDLRVEQEAADERERRVAETVVIIECRRRMSAQDCATTPVVTGNRGNWNECTRRVVVDRVSRNRSCGTR